MTEPNKLNEIEKHIIDAIAQIKFGALEVLIHDSKVVQIERREKVRFDSKG